MAVNKLLYRDPKTTLVSECGRLVDAFGEGPWLVVSPHDDDIILGMGMLIACARREQIEVRAVIVSDGRMGYVHPEERSSIVDVRKRELLSAMACLGVGEEAVFWMELPDGDLVNHVGCNEEGTGLGQRLTAIIREVRAKVVFGPTERDLHPDHRVTSRELDMACCWAESRIWLDMGLPVQFAKRYSYAVYCAFPDVPEYQIRNTSAFASKLDALTCFKSQESIVGMIDRISGDGPVEYIHQAHWVPYRPSLYADIFDDAKRPNGEFGPLFLRGCRAILSVLSAGEIEPWEALVEAMGNLERRPLVIVAEGSSALFAPAFLNSLLRHWEIPGTVSVIGGRRWTPDEGANAQVLFLSNSGQTEELVTVAEAMACPEDALALLGRDGGRLQDLLPRSLVMDGRREETVPATNSVLAQGLYLGHAAAAVAGECVPWKRVEEMVTRGLDGMEEEGGWRIRSGVERVWWVDPTGIVGPELALKTMEVAGIPGVWLNGNQLFHGVEEALSSRDLLIWMVPPQCDRPRLEALEKKCGFELLSLETCPSLNDVLVAEGPWAAWSELVVGWRILYALAKGVGHDPDQPIHLGK
ncbi:MAG: PIG-L family deacetylase [Myxococcota bacterium]|nr:PIG-L family deacetylase [Myxococcota bacterium]